MPALPARTQSPTVAAIYAYWESKPGRVSRRLGASAIGRECERELWYGFRWANAGARTFDGQKLRLFNRGHREEQVFIDELRGAGVTVYDLDPATGQQYEFTAVHGHFVAKIDGVALGIKEAPKTYHVLSFKTAGSKYAADVYKDEKYIAQSQVEMALAELDRTFLLWVNKDNDALDAERIRYDKNAAERLIAKAERVIFAPEPLPGISRDATFYKCKGCSFAGQCHRQALPAVSCRTCLHATPERDGDGRWSCALRGADLSLADQQAACPSHLYIPALVTWGTVSDANEAENWVEYTTADGFVFRNGAQGPGSFLSSELQATTLAFIRSPEAMAIRAQTGGTIVQVAA